MISKLKVVLALTCALSVPSAFAAELVVTQAESASKSSGRVSISLDLASSGDVSGFQFVLRSSEQLKAGSIDTSSCLSDLPKGFSGQCRLNPDGVYFSALASDKSTLPRGVVSLGTLSIPSELAKGALVVEQLEMINAEAEVISSSDQVVR